MNASHDPRRTVAALIGSIALNEFLDSYFPLRPFFGASTDYHQKVKDDVARFVDIERGAPIAGASNYVRLHPTIGNQYSPLKVSTQYAERWADRYTWSIENFETLSSETLILTTALSDLLQIPTDRMAATLFGSASNLGLPWHFDAAEVIVLPIYGSKLWQFSRNKIIDHPLSNCVPSARLAENDMTEREPQPSRDSPGDYEMFWEARPGTCSFLTRGLWHRTEAHSSSISLSIAIRTPTLTDLLINRIAESLSSDQVWRRPSRLDDASALEGCVTEALRTIEDWRQRHRDDVFGERTCF